MFDKPKAVACLLPTVHYAVTTRVLGEINPAGAANIYASSRARDQRYKWSLKNLEQASEIEGLNRLDIVDRKREHIAITGLGNEMMFLGLWFGVEANVSAVEACSREELFTFGAVGDGADALWQGEDQPSTFELAGRAVPDLPRVISAFGDEVLDVSGNAGRWFDTFGARLWAGARMWFGAAFDPVVPLERVRSLPVGEVSDGPNGGVMVRLFEPDDPIELIRERQRVVVDWLRFRWLEEHTEQLRAAYPGRFSG